MKVLLVNEINKYDSIGIELLSACLKERGHESRVCIIPDLIENTTISLGFLKLFKPLFHIDDKKYIKYLLSFQPDVIGFSAVTSWVQRAAHLSRLVKEAAPEVTTIVGGPHPTQVTEHTVRMEAFDYVLKGEGEIMLPDLADALDRGERRPNISGTYWMEDGEIKGYSIGQLVENLDTLPFPDKSDVIRDYPFFEKVYMYNSMRSCAYNCTYCGSPHLRMEYKKFGMQVYRRKTVDKVIEELARAKRDYPKLEVIGFVDDTLTMGREWALEFAKKYKDQVGLPFFGCTNPVLFKDEEIIRSFREAGMVYVEIGVQALDELFRMEEVKRPDSDMDIFESAALLRKHGIYIQVNHIFGLDKRDYFDTDFLKKTVEFYLALRPNRTHCFELEYLPNTKSSLMAVEKGDMASEEYETILRGEKSVAYNFGGSIGDVKAFRPYIVLLEMRPFLPEKAIRFLMNNSFAFAVIKRIPLGYLVLARLLNTIIHSEDVEGRPHYGKYWDGMKRVLRIKKFLKTAGSRARGNGMNEKHVLITGCSSGIGEALVPYLTERGFVVHATARNPRDVELLREKGVSAEVMDMSDMESVREGFQRVIESSKGQLFGLVNNAGYAVRGALEDISAQDARQQFETNVFGPLELSRLAVEVMRKNNGGRIVNVSSIAGLHPFPYLGIYSASKSALDFISDAMHNEVNQDGIHVSVISLGPIATQFQKNTERSLERLEDEKVSNSRVYSALQARMAADKHFSTNSNHALPPEAACKVIHHALSSASPKRRYRVTRVAEIIHLLSRFAPTRVKDAFSRYMIRKLQEKP